MSRLNDMIQALKAKFGGTAPLPPDTIDVNHVPPTSDLSNPYIDIESRANYEGVRRVADDENMPLPEAVVETLKREVKAGKIARKIDLNDPNLVRGPDGLPTKESLSKLANMGDGKAGMAIVKGPDGTLKVEFLGPEPPPAVRKILEGLAHRLAGTVDEAVEELQNEDNDNPFVVKLPGYQTDGAVMNPSPQYLAQIGQKNYDPFTRTKADMVLALLNALLPIVEGGKDNGAHVLNQDEDDQWDFFERLEAGIQAIKIAVETAAIPDDTPIVLVENRKEGMVFNTLTPVVYNDETEDVPMHVRYITALMHWAGTDPDADRIIKEHSRKPGVMGGWKPL